MKENEQCKKKKIMRENIIIMRRIAQAKVVYCTMLIYILLARKKSRRFYTSFWIFLLHFIFYRLKVKNRTCFSSMYNSRISSSRYSKQDHQTIFHILYFMSELYLLDILHFPKGCNSDAVVSWSCCRINMRWWRSSQGKVI